MDETMQAVNEGQVEAPVEEATTEETPVEDTDSAEVETDSEVVENTSEVEAEGRNVPYDRLKEVIDERNFLREQIARVQSQAPVPQSQPQAVEQIPQHLVDPVTGDVDPIGYQNWVKQQAVEAARKEYQQQRALDKAWGDAETTYPELTTDSEARDLVDAAIRGEFAKGNFVTPKQMAEKIFGRMKTAEKAGIKKAQVSTSIQKAAAVPATESNPEPVASFDRLKAEAMETGDWTKVMQNILKG